MICISSIYVFTVRDYGLKASLFEIELPPFMGIIMVTCLTEGALNLIP